MTDQSPENAHTKHLEVELVVNDRAEAVVFYNKPFEQELSWLEFDLDTNKLDFILDEGEMRSFAVAVNPQLSKYMQNAFQVLMVLTDYESGEPQEGNYFPLIIHRD